MSIEILRKGRIHLKKYLPVLSIVMTAMAAIPAVLNHDVFTYCSAAAQPVAAEISSREYPLPDSVTFTDISDGQSVTRSTKSVIYSLVGAVCEKDFIPDEVKALCIAIHTQLCIENESGTLAIDTKDKSIYLSDSELKNKFSSDYTALCSYCDNVYSTLLLSDGRPVPIFTLPFCSTKERTSPPIADPYDTLFSADSAGESNGITPVLARMMSQQGLTYNEILNYCYNV